jgi:initiation factor 1A
MVKNTKGGNKSKKIGRKFINAPIDRTLRLAVEKEEIYAVVTKLLGNGMFYANDPDGNERLCIMRNKFRGRGKRDNTLKLGCWVLIGERDFEVTQKPKCDLLEVYNDGEKERLKKTGNPIFKKLKSEHDTHHKLDESDDIIFENEEDTDYKNLLNSNKDDGEISTTDNIITMEDEDGEEFTIDDI